MYERLQKISFASKLRDRSQQILIKPSQNVLIRNWSFVMVSFSRLTFSVVLLTTTASLAQAQNADTRGFKSQGSAVQPMNGGGTSGKPAESIAQPEKFGASSAGASGASGKMGFQDALKSVRDEHRILEADRKKMKYDTKMGNTEALEKDKQKLEADRKAAIEKFTKASEERDAQLKQIEEKKKQMARDKQGGLASGAQSKL